VSTEISARFDRNPDWSWTANLDTGVFVIDSECCGVVLTPEEMRFLMVTLAEMLDDAEEDV
jgi:hypothetical protein